jgi:hypothetical protein
MAHQSQSSGLGFPAQLGLQFGSSLLGGLGGLFQGKSDLEGLQEDQLRQIMQFAQQSQQNRAGLSSQIQGELGGLNPNQNIDNLSQSLQPFLQRLLGQQSKSLGLDSGLAQKAAFGGFREQLAGLLAQENRAVQGQRTNLLGQLGRLT